MNLTSEQLKPPAYVPTEQEHRIAYLKQVLETVVYDTLLPLHMGREGDIVALTPERRAEEVEEWLGVIDGWFKRWEDGDPNKTLWELVFPYDSFKARMISNLADRHGGDCIYAPSSCVRCYAEELYEILPTATWCKECLRVEGLCDDCKEKG
jgi:hypothetical protein